MRRQPITVSAGWREERPAAPSGQRTADSGQRTVRDPHGPQTCPHYCPGTGSASLAKNSTPVADKEGKNL